MDRQITMRMNKPSDETHSALDARVQGTCVALAVERDAPLYGLMVLGPSGIGKSSLALALIENCPFQQTALIGDDMVALSSEGADKDVLYAKGLPPIEGLIEVRGFGPAKTRHAPLAPIGLAMALSDQAGERIKTTENWVPEFANNGADWRAPAVPNIPFLRYCVANFAWCDHAFRVRTIFRSVLSGQSG